MNNKIRVRFAPSPTGPLHIGGVRTALYNYLLAKKFGGSFILRIEDTDQKRYMAGAEDYIREALAWLGISADEGPVSGGDFGPYRQSERKSIYLDYAQRLVSAGKAYYAFDSPQDLEEMRRSFKEQGVHTPKYDWKTRSTMQNGLTLEAPEVQELLKNSVNTVIRLKVPKDETIEFDDVIRGHVSFQSNELDDKVLLKADGMPTYHLANIVDDHLMNISHVIRGEEWLSSTAHHVLLYQAFGWEDTMPEFAHLPLILNPNGKGKLSKRDGAKFGFPVFPLAWKGENEEDAFTGFREDGFDPAAVINFLALLGWNSGTEQEIFSLEELIQEFSVEKIVKAGARFDFEKAKWFNQQYIHHKSSAQLLEEVRTMLPEDISETMALSYIDLFKERVTLLKDFYSQGYYFFEDIKTFDEKMIRKKWKNEHLEQFHNLEGKIAATENFIATELENTVKGFIQEHALKFGDFFPILRLALTGTMSGPDLFKMMELLGQGKSVGKIKSRLEIISGH